jgi:hypothetical protein
MRVCPSMMNRATARPAGLVGANAADRIQFFEHGTITLCADRREIWLCP